MTSQPLYSQIRDIILRAACTGRISSRDLDMVIAYIQDLRRR